MGEVPAQLSPCPESQAQCSCPACPKCDDPPACPNCEDYLPASPKACRVCSCSPGSQKAAKDPSLVAPVYEGLDDFTTLEYSVSHAFITEVIPRLNNFQEFLHFKVEEAEDADFLFVSTTYNEELAFPE